jgi:gluconate 2-dehydrogenase gamma chain
MDACLKQLEGGKVDLDSVPSNVFLSSLLEVTIEGYFSDPVYGGNRDMVSWKMIGEPRSTVPDFQGQQMHDELRYSIRKALMQDTAGGAAASPAGK